jgi:hypothetical protein
MTKASGNRPRRGSSIVDRIDFYTQAGDPKECWLWKGNHHRQGYAVLKVDYQTRYVHRLLMEEVHGTLPSTSVVMHLCNNHGCVNPFHLHVGTASDNYTDAQRDRLITGPMAAKFTMDQARDIRDSKKSCRQLGRELGVTHQTISNIRLGKTYIKDHTLNRSEV